MAIRDWAESDGYTIRHSGSDEKLIIQYCNPLQLSMWNDDDIASVKNLISRKIAQIATKYRIDYDLNFEDISYGELAAVIKLGNKLTREEARNVYYDLLKLGPNMTTEQFRKLNRLRDAYGFR